VKCVGVTPGSSDLPCAVPKDMTWDDYWAGFTPLY
jgi:hypothetical protein